VALILVIGRLVGNDIPQGWTSLVTIILITSGAILFALGTLAEYLGVAVNMAMGRPAYLIVSDPADGPLGWGAAHRSGPGRLRAAPLQQERPPQQSLPADRLPAERSSQEGG